MSEHPELDALVPDLDQVREIWVDYHLDPLPRAVGVPLVPVYGAAFDEMVRRVTAVPEEAAEFRTAVETIYRKMLVWEQAFTGVGEPHDTIQREIVPALREAIEGPGGPLREDRR